MRTLLSLVVLAAVVQPQGWPFGGRGFRGGDYYNLGVLGIKASDPDRTPAQGTPLGGGKKSFQMERGGGDEGPARFKVEILFPGGPAEKAGVKPGDFIVGVGAAKFKKGSLAPLAKALLKAESAKGTVTLLLERGGKRMKIAVPVPVAGKEAAKPTEGKGRRMLVDQALQWLAKRQAADGGYAPTLSGTNGAVVQTALAGLAWLGAGSDLEKGPFKENIRRAVDYVAKNVKTIGSELGGAREPGGPSWNQANWGYAHAAIFLGELHARTPERSVLEPLTYCATRLVETQEKSGGWAHGPGGPNALGYLELNIVTGLALCGLGLASRNGFVVPPETLERAEAYLQASSGGGGVGYSDRPGQKGAGNIGRTAGAWLGYLALGKGKSKFGKSMGAYVKRNVDKPLGGHASLMQHILLAGVAAHVSGRTAKVFWKAMERDLVLAHSPDGSFQPRPWHESLGMSSNSDVSFGEVWTTAAWTIILVAAPTKDGMVGFPAWYGR